MYISLTCYLTIRKLPRPCYLKTGYTSTKYYHQAVAEQRGGGEGAASLGGTFTGAAILVANVLFNDALNTFYLQLYGIRHMVKDHSDSERGNPVPPHGLLFPISSKGSFICIIPQTG